MMSQALNRAVAALLLFATSCVSAAPTLSLSAPARVKWGDAVTLQLLLAGGNEPYGGFNARISLPQGVNVVGVEPGALLPADFVIDSRVTETTTEVWLALVAYSNTASMTGTDGVLLDITLQATDSAAPGTHTIAFASTNPNPVINTRHALSDAQGARSVPHDVASTQVVIVSTLDNDGDGIPDATDPDDDNDGVSDVQEAAMGTNPKKPDSDNDGVSDLIDPDPTNPTVQAPTGVLDIDGDGAADALTDGLLVIRRLFGFTGGSLVSGALTFEARRMDSLLVADYLDGNASWLDVDDNGEADALTDGLLVIRYLFGFSGDALIRGAVASDAERTLPGDLESYIEALLP